MPHLLLLLTFYFLMCLLTFDWVLNTVIEELLDWSLLPDVTFLWKGFVLFFVFTSCRHMVVLVV